MDRKTYLKELVLLLGISIIFLTLSIANLKYVGVSSDESSPGLWGVYLLKNKNVNSGSNKNIHFFGKEFPTNFIQSYSFSLPSYMLVPFFFVFGINIITLKFMSIFTSWLTLLMIYYVLKNIFNRKIAFITNLLLAISPLFVHYTRIGLHTTEPLLNFFFIGSIFFLILYIKERNNFYLYLFAFFFGCGFSVKLSILSRLLGLLTAGMILFPKKILHFNKIFKIKQLIFIAVFFLAGSFLFIYYNVATKGKTFKLAKYLFTNQITTYPDLISGINNLDFLNNFKRRAEHFICLIKEKMDYDFPYPNMINRPRILLNRDTLLYVFWLAFVFNLLYFLYKRNKPDHKKVLFIYIFYMIMFFTSFFSPWSLRQFHLTLLYPFPQFVVALFIDNLNNLVKYIPSSRMVKKTINSFIYIFVLIPVIVINMNILFLYHSMYRNTGGHGIWSGYVYDLIDYIKKNNIYPIFVIDWGLHETVPFITIGEMDFSYDLARVPLPEKDFKEKLSEILSKIKIAYFINIFDIYGKENEHTKWLKEHVKQANIKLMFVKVFLNKINDPVYAIYKIEQR